MSDVAPKQAKYLKDYQAPAYGFETVDLCFDLTGELTTVDAKILVVRNGEHNNPLELVGNSLKLESVSSGRRKVGR